MMKRILVLLILIATLLCLSSCSNTSNASTFSIRFIDVGQGDSALIECDGHYMLIDGGEKTAGEKVYNVLEEQRIQHLDILAVSHLHTDHYGGLIKALTYASAIDLTICNSKHSDTETFRSFEHELATNGTKITVPSNGDKYELGSATVEVIDVCSNEDNDSLVLLITYGNTRFLFPGDIQRKGQLRVTEVLREKYSNFRGQSLIKMPHHGAYNDVHGFFENNLNGLFQVYNPSYFVISVGKENKYGHPHQETLDVIENILVRSKGLDWNSHVFRTDLQGDIIVKSNGKQISVETTR